mgnify:FL=1
MTAAKALRLIPPAALELYRELRRQGDTTQEAVRNVYIVLASIVRRWPAKKG